MSANKVFSCSQYTTLSSKDSDYKPYSESTAETESNFGIKALENFSQFQRESLTTQKSNTNFNPGHPSGLCNTGLEDSSLTHTSQTPNLKSNFKRFSCSLCPLRFHLKTDLKRHIRVFKYNQCVTSGGFSNNLPECTVGSENFSEFGFFESKVSCDNTVTSDTNLIRLPQQSTFATSQNRSVVFNNNDANQTRPKKYSNVKIKRFLCPMCPLRFYLKTDLKRHILVHTGEKPFSCPRCSRKFRRETHLRNHLAKKIACSKLCKIVFFLPYTTLIYPSNIPELTSESFSGSLIQSPLDKSNNDLPYFSLGNLSTTSTFEVSSRDYISNSAKNNIKAKRFGCTMCHFRFHLRSDLERHILVHTGEKPFSCPRCSRKFRQESHLRKHLAKKILCIP
ncbi:Zinc finger protein [Armadillidium vulgare]|nr:Zinc finger protein [Armadillidium vulgare]